MGADRGGGARNLPPVDFEKKLKLKKEGNVQNSSTKKLEASPSPNYSSVLHALW
jgi:hypothetical protein